MLWSLDSEINLGQIVRHCYTLGHRVVFLHIFDPQRVIERNLDAVRRFSNYSLDRYENLKIYSEMPLATEVLDLHHGRVICFAPDEQAVPVHEFSFQDGDLLIFGNEYTGLPPSVLSRAAHKVVIPMLGRAYPHPNPTGKATHIGTQRCLGVSAAVTIAVYASVLHVTGYRDWRPDAEEATA